MKLIPNLRCMQFIRCTILQVKFKIQSYKLIPHVSMYNSMISSCSDVIPEIRRGTQSAVRSSRRNTKWFCHPCFMGNVVPFTHLWAVLGQVLDYNTHNASCSVHEGNTGRADVSLTECQTQSKMLLNASICWWEYFSFCVADASSSIILNKHDINTTHRF